MPSEIPEIPIRKSDSPTLNQEQSSKDYQESEGKKNSMEHRNENEQNESLAENMPSEENFKKVSFMSPERGFS